MTVKIKNHNMIFVNIPKTAGVSISRWLAENVNGQYLGKPIEANKHMIFRKVAEKYNPEFTFSVVRNPWDRLVSGFHYYNKKRSPSVRGKTFETFVRSKKLGKLGKNQYHYLQDAMGDIGVDYVIRFENLDEDFKKIQDMLDCHIPLTKSNSTAHTNYTNYYTKETRDIVKEIYAADIKEFGYSFSRPQNYFPIRPE